MKIENGTALCPCCKKRIPVQQLRPDARFNCQVCGSHLRRTSETPPRLEFARNAKTAIGTSITSLKNQSNVALPSSTANSLRDRALLFAENSQKFVFSRPKRFLMLGALCIAGITGYIGLSNANHKTGLTGNSPSGKVAENSSLPKDQSATLIEEYSVQEIVAMYDRSVCRIETGESLGTGFVVGPLLVVSNRHVIGNADAPSIRLFFSDGTVDPEWTSYRVSELMIARGRTDLVVLKVPQLPSLRAIPMQSINDLQRGEPIIVIGNPSGLRNVVSEGNFGSIQTLDGLKYVQLTATIHPGNSGGPAITRKGKLAGVVTLKSINNEGIGLAIPGDQLYEFLNKALAE